MQTQEKTISEVIQDHSRMQTASGAEAFWAGFLVMYCLSEMLGSVLGWPTIAGRLYVAFGFGSEFPGLLQMLAVLAPQLAIQALAVYIFLRTNWPTWLFLRLRQLPNSSLPETNRRATSLGLLTGFVFAGLLDFLLHSAPAERGPLIEFELGIFALTGIATALALLQPGTKHFSIPHPDDTVFERIPKLPFQVQVVPNRTEFQKSILLRKLPGHYEASNFDGPIRLDECEHVLFNYGVYEKKISASVSVSSANLFKCEGMFSLDVHPPPDGEIVGLNTRGVEILINNLYIQHDFAHFLKERLTAAMHVYAGAFDTEMKTITEGYSLQALEQELDSSHGFRSAPQNLGALLNAHTAYLTQLDVHQNRSERALTQLRNYNTRWLQARTLQQRGVLDLPVFFERSLLKFFADKLNGTDTAAEASIAKLLGWARVRFFVSTFDFTPAAVKAEALLHAETDRLRAELKQIEQTITTTRSTQAADFRAMLRERLASMDPRLAMTPRGREWQHGILALLLLDDRAVVEQAPSLLGDFPVTTAATKVIDGAATPLQPAAKPASPLPSWVRNHSPNLAPQSRAESSGPVDDALGSSCGGKVSPVKPKRVYEEPF